MRSFDTALRITRFFACGAAPALTLVVAASAHSLDMPVSASAEVLAATIEIGFDAEALSAAGLAPSDVESLLARVSSAEAARATWLAAREALASVNSLLSVDGDNDVPAESPSLIAARDAADAALDEAEAGLRSAALDSLPAATVSTLNALHLNRRRTVPVEFRVLELTEPQWRDLAQAVRAEGRANRTGEEMDADSAELLAGMRSQPSVAAAKTAVESHRTEIEAVFNP